MVNKKNTAVLPIKAASIKLLVSDEDIYEMAKTSPPSIRNFEINSLRKEIAERSASKFFLAWLISAVSMAWIGEFTGSDLVWSIGAYLGLVLMVVAITGVILSMANIRLGKYYIPLFASFPGNSKTKFYIKELQKMKS